MKNYANYIAEQYNEGAETHEKLIEYVEYLRTNVQNVSEYANYIAESINENLVVEGDDVTAKEFDEADKDNELEKVGDNSGEANKADGGAGVEKEDLDNDLEEVDNDNKREAEGEGADDKAAENEGEEGAHDPLESYKNEISSKLEALVEKATAKENKKPHFFKLVGSSTIEKYESLEEEAKTSVRSEVEGAGFLTESQIVRIIENVNEVAGNASNEPFFITAMPEEYKEKWSSLSESKKKQITAQSKTRKLETEYQVRNFWQTRDLREFAPVMEKVEMVTESKETETKKLPYSLHGIQEELAKRFNNK